MSCGAAPDSPPGGLGRNAINGKSKRSLLPDEPTRHLRGRFDAIDPTRISKLRWGSAKILHGLDLTARHSPESQILARELADGVAPHQFHVALYFGSHEGQRPLDPSLAGRGQR